MLSSARSGASWAPCDVTALSLVVASDAATRKGKKRREDHGTFGLLVAPLGFVGGPLKLLPRGRETR